MASESTAWRTYQVMCTILLKFRSSFPGTKYSSLGAYLPPKRFSETAPWSLQFSLLCILSTNEFCLLFDVPHRCSGVFCPLVVIAVWHGQLVIDRDWLYAADTLDATETRVVKAGNETKKKRMIKKVFWPRFCTVRLYWTGDNLS